MKQSLLWSAAALLILNSCTKMNDLLTTYPVDASPAASSPVVLKFRPYTIKKNNHYCDQSVFRPVAITGLKFTVRFDSSAIYQTVSPENQYDINKLYGFSDNRADHHQFSARFGWRWSDSALHLFAYCYNNGIMASKELGTVPIGSDITCSIAVMPSTYIFTLNGQSETVPRLSTTPTAQGYLLYPYFGGDETAPHDIRLWIKDL